MGNKVCCHDSRTQDNKITGEVEPEPNNIQVYGVQLDKILESRRTLFGWEGQRNPGSWK